MGYFILSERLVMANTTEDGRSPSSCPSVSFSPDINPMVEVTQGRGEDLEGVRVR